MDPDRPVAVSVRGHASLVADPERRTAVAAGWAFTPDETFLLFELDLQAVAIGSRASADDWPPTYARWGD